MKSFILVSMMLLSFSVFAEGQKAAVEDCDRGCQAKVAANIDGSDVSAEEVEKAKADAEAKAVKGVKGQ